ncbi:MAG TPA: hypothetical protein VJU86_15070 [Pyrinomonadaceae bacterium]|nr:hypothetical protein [Pyrinomonadaceae bacterium]
MQLLGVRRLVGALAAAALRRLLINTNQVAQTATGESADKAAHSKELNTSCRGQLCFGDGK